MLRVRACVREIGMEVVMLFVEMLAPALLTWPAVPIVTIRAVFWCARGDGFLRVGAEELWGMEMSFD